MESGEYEDGSYPLGLALSSSPKRKKNSPSEGYGESGGTFLLVYRANVAFPTLKDLLENVMPYLNLIHPMSTLSGHSQSTSVTG